MGRLDGACPATACPWLAERLGPAPPPAPDRQARGMGRPPRIATPRRMQAGGGGAGGATEHRDAARQRQARRRALDRAAPAAAGRVLWRGGGCRRRGGRRAGAGWDVAQGQARRSSAAGAAGVDDPGAPSAAARTGRQPADTLGHGRAERGWARPAPPAGSRGSQPGGESMLGLAGRGGVPGRLRPRGDCEGLMPGCRHQTPHGPWLQGRFLLRRRSCRP